MRIYFIRHGQTNYNVKNLCNNDPKKKVYLTKLGKREIEDVARKLKNKNIDIIFVSQLPRTIQSAKIINKFHAAPIKIDSRINDRRTGFEGKPYFEYVEAIEKDKFYSKFNDGESFQEEKRRIFSFLMDLKKLNFECVLVVTHEETIKISLGYFNRLSNEEMWNIKVANAQIFELKI